MDAQAEMVIRSTKLLPPENISNKKGNDISSRLEMKIVATS